MPAGALGILTIMRAPAGLATAALLLLATSCNDPLRIHGSPIHLLDASAIAVTSDTQSYCAINTTLSSQLASLPPWAGRITVDVSRWVATTGGVLASRDTTLVLSFTVTQDSSRLVFAFGAPLNDTLFGSVVSAPTYQTSGAWTCPATLPFADNSQLLSKGYQAVPAPSGSWSLRWLAPVD